MMKLSMISKIFYIIFSKQTKAGPVTISRAYQYESLFRLIYKCLTCTRVSEDADVSADEGNDHSEDNYEDSFINDQATPTGQFTQSVHHGENSGDMMAFYRYYYLIKQHFLISTHVFVLNNPACVILSAPQKSAVGHVPCAVAISTFHGSISVKSSVQSQITVYCFTTDWL